MKMEKEINEFDKVLSIIIPIYNCDKYINRCVDSILNQSNIDNDIEVILVDDGSTDNSGSICDSYSKINPLVKCYHKNNTGVSDTRNYGLSKASAKYITFMDSDDYIDNNYIEEIKNIINNKCNYDIINFGFYSDVENLKFQQLSSDKINYKECEFVNSNNIKEEFISLWDHAMFYNIWNKVYKSSFLKENNIIFPEDNVGEDVIFNEKCLLRTSKLYNSEKCFYHYIREREGAATNKYNSNMFEFRKREYIEFNAFFDEYGIAKEEYYEFSSRRFIERVLGCIENVYSSNMTFKQRYCNIKEIINDDLTRKSLKFAIPKSKKVKLMLIPIKCKSVILTMSMGKAFNFVKKRFPSIFNKLKNRR